MNFKQRLLRYLIGVGIGCVIVYAMFPNRNWLGWTPGNTVFRTIAYFGMDLSDRARCQLACDQRIAAGITHAAVFGKVDFGKSETEEKQKKYLITLGQTKMTVAITDTIVTLEQISRPPVSCDCP
jgi:hypothetical protein